MLTIRLGECTDCANLCSLISKIDSKLLYYGVNHLNNTRLLTCLDFNYTNIDLLLTYKRVLNNRLFNPNYACEINLASIISRIKVLLNK